MRRIAFALFLASFALIAIPAQAGASTARTVAFPTATGSFGQAPSIKFPTKTPPSTLQEKVLHLGTGPVINKHDLLVVNYLGQIWQGKVFDSSYQRKLLAGFPIGVGGVIPGWDKELVGQHVGSRVLLVIPPVDGYGSKGDSNAGITGKDTLVFVIDLVARYQPSVGGDTKATPLSKLPKGITVNGKLGSPPSVTVAKNTSQPTSPSLTVIDNGTGTKLKAGLVVVEIAAFSWTGAVVDSTWKDGTPAGETIGDPSNPSVLDALVGDHIGSRVVVELPKSTQEGGPYVLVMDIVAEPQDPQTT